MAIVRRFRTPTVELRYAQGGLWGRIKLYQGKTLIKRKSGTWELYDGLPGQYEPNAEFTYDPLYGFSPGEGIDPDAYGYEGCDRLYLGGHDYYLSPTLEAELVAAGYEAYITSVVLDHEVCEGDEIMVSGRNSTHHQDTEAGCDTVDGVFESGFGSHYFNYNGFGGF